LLVERQEEKLRSKAMHHHHHHVMILMCGGDGGGGGVNCSHTKKFVVEVVAMKLRMMRMKGKRREEKSSRSGSRGTYMNSRTLDCLALPYLIHSSSLCSLSRICSALSVPLATNPL
jgi:hypothetical protein